MQGLDAHAQSLSRSILSLANHVNGDMEAVQAFRDTVLRVLRSTESALYAFKRSYLWRESAKVRHSASFA